MLDGPKVDSGTHLPVLHPVLAADELQDTAQGRETCPAL